MLAVVDRSLPYLGPGLALVLGVAALGRRSLDVGEAAAVAAAQGSFSDVVERALSDDPARAGYLALLQPVVAWNDAEHWARLPSVAAAVLAAVAAYRLGRRLAGRHAGAAASVLLATSVGVVLLSRTVGPLALALAAMLLSSALFARAVERGNAVWWAVYAVSAALLPLTHPIAATALGAQILALVAARREVNLRLAVPAIGVATVECAFFLAAAAIDRADAADGAGALELRDIGAGVGRAVGWSPVVAGLAVWGVIALFRRADGAGEAVWKPVLVGGLAVLPLVAVLLTGIGLPVHPRTALTVAAGGVSLAAGVGLVSIRDRALRLVSLAAVAVVAVAALGTAADQKPREDWRAAAQIVRAKTTPRDTVVVLPERARSAFAYYAPGVRTSLVGRGDGVTVVVVGDPDAAVAVARQVVAPPRYALLSEQPAGSRIVVQRWVRP
jgi:dolichyl-phosphate-mannose-protein mannosyltransferase